MQRQFRIAWLRFKVFAMDRMPWFARKRLLNWFMGREVFHDLQQAEASYQRRPFSDICIKW